jgi:quinoprotein relay system zinc metallohydrolase 2
MPNPSRRALLAGAAAGLARSRTVAAAVPPVLATVEIAAGVHVARGRHAVMGPDNGGHIANLGIVVGSEAVAVVDSGGSHAVGVALRAAVAAITDRPVRYLIHTHVHPDHVFGATAFTAGPGSGRGHGPEIVGHAKHPRALSARAARYLAHHRDTMGAAGAGTDVVMPTRLVTDTATLDLGGRTLTLRAHATAHTDNDLTVRDDTTGTLFTGDLLFAEHIPTLDGSLRGWITELGRLETTQAARLVPGHGPESLPWPAGFAPQRRYLEAVSTAVRAVIARGGTIEEAMRGAARDESAAWLLSAEYHTRTIAAAFAELEWE